MTMMMSTCDVIDEHPEACACDVQMRDFGVRSRFAGTIRTVRCHEDNGLVRQVLSTASEGEVLVVDGGGSLHAALMGDRIAGLAAGNGWAGVVIWGAVRDSAALKTIDLGVKALGTNPTRSLKLGHGSVDVPVSFGGVTFRPGDRLFADEDGVVVLPAR